MNEGGAHGFQRYCGRLQTSREVIEDTDIPSHVESRSCGVAADESCTTGHEQGWHGLWLGSLVDEPSVNRGEVHHD